MGSLLNSIDMYSILQPKKAVQRTTNTLFVLYIRMICMQRISFEGLNCIKMVVRWYCTHRHTCKRKKTSKRLWESGRVILLWHLALCKGMHVYYGVYNNSKMTWKNKVNSNTVPLIILLSLFDIPKERIDICTLTHYLTCTIFLLRTQ